MMITSSDTNCTYYNEESFEIVAIIRASVGSLSAFFCLLVVGMIVLYKKYRCFCQRLILYLAVAAFIHSLSYPLARINYYTPRQLLSPYCNFGGFFNLYTSWTELLALCCLTFNVFLNAVLDKWLTKLECIYVCLPYLLPVSWMWIPLVDASFGNGEAWCDIRPVEADCSKYTLGTILRFSLWYGPLSVLCLIMLVAAIVAAVRIRKDSKQWYTLHDPFTEQKARMLRSEVRPLLWYPVFYSLLSIFSIANQISVAVNPTHSVIALWYLHVLTSPFRGAAIVLAYALDRDTRKRLTWAQFRTAIYHWCRGNDVNDYTIINCSVGDSITPENSSRTN